MRRSARLLTLFQGVGVPALDVTAGNLIDAFGAASEWTASNATLADEAGHIGNAVRLTATGTTARMVKTGFDFGVKDFGSVGFWANISKPNAVTTINLYLATDNTLANAYKFSWSSRDVKEPGRQWLAQAMSGATVVGSINSVTQITAVAVELVSTAVGASMAVDSLCYNRKTKPQLLLTFDDGWATQFGADGTAYLESKGLKGTFYIVENRIGTTDYADLASIQAAYAAGHDIGNHTKNHLGFNRDGTDGSINGIAQAQAPAASFTLNGALASGGTVTLPEAACIVFTPATTGEAGKSVTVTGTLGGQAQSETLILAGNRFVVTLSAFDVVTGITISSAASGNISVGRSHYYSEIVTSLTSCRDYLIANGMPRAANHVAFPYGETNTLVDTALAALGMKTARLAAGDVTSGLTYPIASGLPNPMKTAGYVALPTDTANTLYGLVAQAISAGTVVNIANHRIDLSGDTIAVTPTVFRGFIDLVAAQVAAGNLDVRTITDHYARLPRDNTAEPPAIGAFVAAKQLLRYSHLPTNTTYWANAASVQVAQATGISAPAGISDDEVWTITDNNAGGFSDVDQSVAVPASGSVTLTVYIKKDTNQSRFPEIRFDMGVTGRNYRMDLNTATGALTARINGSSLTSSTATLVLGKDGVTEWWKVVLVGLVGTGTLCGCALFPAIGTTAGTAVNTATGSITYCGWMVELGTTSDPYEKRYT